jgi:hypothetical protein
MSPSKDINKVTGLITRGIQTKRSRISYFQKREDERANPYLQVYGAIPPVGITLMIPSPFVLPPQVPFSW